MAEVTRAGEDHCEVVRVGGGDDLVVAHRAAGLDDRGGAGFDRGEQAVGEGEEGVGGDNGPVGKTFDRAGRLRRILGLARVDSSRIAARKAEDAAQAAGSVESLANGSVVASDAFFPFADGLLAAVEAGATAIIQPGGSIRDDEVIAAADEAGLAMVFTGMRHFRH